MQIPDRRAFAFLLVPIVVLVGMHLFVEAAVRLSDSFPVALHNRFDLDVEANVPAWYSTVLLFTVALAAFVIHRWGAATGSERRRWPWFWLVMATVFCLISLDEAARLHEAIDDAGYPKWVFFYAPLFAGLFAACTYYLFAIRDDPELRRWIIAGLIVGFGGGVGAESVMHGFELSSRWEEFEVIVEEGLELVGTSMVLVGCVHELKRIGAARRLVR